MYCHSLWVGLTQTWTRSHYLYVSSSNVLGCSAEIDLSQTWVHWGLRTLDSISDQDDSTQTLFGDSDSNTRDVWLTETQELGTQLQHWRKSTFPAKRDLNIHETRLKKEIRLWLNSDYGKLMLCLSCRTREKRRGRCCFGYRGGVWGEHAGPALCSLCWNSRLLQVAAKWSACLSICSSWWPSRDQQVGGIMVHNV